MFASSSTTRSLSTSRKSKSNIDVIIDLTRGDPAQLLKSVNPSEAGILDAASKCHIRFRLGGDVITYDSKSLPLEISSPYLLQDFRSWFSS